MNYLKFYNSGIRKMQAGGMFSFLDMLEGKAGLSAYMDAKKLDLKQKGLSEGDSSVLTMDLLMQKYASPFPAQGAQNPKWSATQYADQFELNLQQYQPIPSNSQSILPTTPNISQTRGVDVLSNNANNFYLSPDQAKLLILKGISEKEAVSMMLDDGLSFDEVVNSVGGNDSLNQEILSTTKGAPGLGAPSLVERMQARRALKADKRFNDYMAANKDKIDGDILRAWDEAEDAGMIPEGQSYEEFSKQYIEDNRDSFIKEQKKSEFKAGADLFEQAMSSKGAKLGLTAGVAALNMVDLATMGDKNFGALSQAIDGAVHAASGALMSSGNPYLMLAGAGIEGLNFLTKATGQTTEGFDVDIKSSGYGQLGHYDSKSNRDFGAMFGLGGLNQNKIDRLLEKRNLAAQMALKAANVSDTIAYEQEARMNSVDDTIQKNEIALQGGVDTSLLAAKHGAKLVQKEQPEVVIDVEPEVEEEIVSAKNGAKLEKVEVSDEKSVIPEGAMHKNKNNLNLGTTEKGIPVITTENEIKEGTRQEIEKEGGEITQHAEVEASEIIFSKELTDYVEDSRKKWKESDKKDSDLLLEVGKRIVKEIMTNTDDNTDLIPKMEELL